MKYLLYTHTILWSLTDSPLPSPEARKRLATPGSTFYASAASGWEIATKHRTGKLAGVSRLVTHFEEEMTKAGTLLLAVILVAQARLEQMVLLSKDTKLDAFGAQRIW